MIMRFEEVMFYDICPVGLLLWWVFFLGSFWGGWGFVYGKWAARLTS